MLRVSTRGEYGVRLMVDLAHHYGGKARSLTEISQAEGLDAKIQYLEQLIKCLREQNLVESTRGAHGGYRLSRPPEQMRMGDIVRALEGPIAPMICANEADVAIECDRLDGCSTKYLWIRVRDAITNALDSMTLADLAAASSGAGIGTPRFVALTPRVERVERRSSIVTSTADGL
ncbi:MAG: RrF2 family transcriptional regulator [Ktedonobacterales bacterium]